MQRADPLLTQSTASSESATNPPASVEPKEGGTEEGRSEEKNVKEEEMETVTQLSSIEYEKMKDTNRKP